MLDDLFKLLRSPRWVNSPIACRLGFGSELSYEEDVSINAPSNWTKLSTSGRRPPVRSGHSSLVVDDMMYVFGGYNDGNCHNDIYAFDLVRHHWLQIETSNGISPDGRASHAWCISTDKTSFYLYGGSGPHWGQTNMGKLLQFNIREKNWTIVETEGKQPPPGYGQSMCAINNRLYLFGGTSGHVYVNDLYVFDEVTKIWRKEETNGNRPSPRYKHQVAIVGNRMYVVGGGLYDPPKGPIDTYYLDVDTLEWHEVECGGDIPKSRIAHTISQLSRDPYRLLMFGGRDDTGSRQNELSELNLRTGEWQIHYNDEGLQPDARDFHTTVVYNDHIFVFGGSNGVERNNDVFRYTMTYQASTLVILSMQALRRSLKNISEEKLALLPFELKLGVKNINSDVQSSYNLDWYILDDQKQDNVAIVQ
ncbi:Kelch repeat-containing proteins [Plasmopara halstedii]|uniref:Kelch repeat-containing proteins n=1 Tax=Plasmopara halstedii TaxID=4781 RepID=A0A0P1ASF4_PLAHL|nr:Kelch repeat-containing proteins [Plasmopara halstedii]CEG43782.1 Kelch repeat-containing proteins [Plasmopara halstedii]|eukprot:XP_024580151.1 Kelch repeat-containing proteins [Plasmopara halstedii]